MRIAQVAPLYESVPPRLSGGTERIVSYVTEELVRRGHDVTLFASGDSHTAARLVAVPEWAPRLDANTREVLAADFSREHGRVFRNAQRFSVGRMIDDYEALPPRCRPAAGAKFLADSAGFVTASRLEQVWAKTTRRAV